MIKIIHICLLFSSIFFLTVFSFTFEIKQLIRKPIASPSHIKMVDDNKKLVESTLIENEISETPEEKYKREKLAEIAERKAEEVFVTRSTGKYECQACGYVYDEAKGYAKKGIAPGTPFDEIEKFRCPECGANKKYFVQDLETLSGFKDNLKYGLGGNAMTGAQKGNLIYGGLFIAFAVFMSGYLLE